MDIYTFLIMDVIICSFRSIDSVGSMEMFLAAREQGFISMPLRTDAIERTKSEIELRGVSYFKLLVSDSVVVKCKIIKSKLI